MRKYSAPIDLVKKKNNLGISLESGQKKITDERNKLHTNPIPSCWCARTCWIPSPDPWTIQKGEKMSLRYQERGPCILVGTQIFNIRSITGDRLAHSSLSAPSFSPGIQREASDLQSQFRLIHQLYSVLTDSSRITPKSRCPWWCWLGLHNPRGCRESRTVHYTRCFSIYRADSISTLQ